MSAGVQRTDEQKQEMAAQVLSAMCNGLSLRKSCEAVSLSPNTFLDWCEVSTNLSVQYARARERLMDWQAEDLESISDQAVNAETAVEVNGLRLKSDNRKWLLSKLAPKRYGDKLAIGGSDDMPAIRTDGTLTIEPGEAYKRLLGG